jgi:hypothetical protein
MTDEPNLFLEADFAAQLGIQRSDVAALRREHLIEGVDFKKNPAVSFTDAGYEKMMALLALQEAPAAPETVEVTVIRKVPNPAVVVAIFTDPEKGTDLLTVRVPVRHVPGAIINFFAVGDIIPAVHVEGATYTHRGPAPRYAGDRNAIRRA